MSINRIQEGNATYLQGGVTFDHSSEEKLRRDLSSNGQRPFAIVVACADSRVPVERVFNVGPGELFVLRVAGNVINEDILASIEFGVLALKAQYCIVLGHTQCGAVAAACEYSFQQKDPGTPHLRTLVHKIGITDNKEVSNEDLLQNSIECNVRKSIEDITRGSEALLGEKNAGRLHLSGAIYSLATGQVRFLSEAN